MINFCRRDNLHRDTAPVPFLSIIYQDKDPSIYQICIANAPERNKTCARNAKSTPYLTCHRESFSAKAPGPGIGWLRQVTLTNYTTGPLLASGGTISANPIFL